MTLLCFSDVISPLCVSFLPLLLLLDSFLDDLKITLLASSQASFAGGAAWRGGEEEVERHHGAERRRDRAGTQ